MDLNSLPRPARSASNQEVRQGSREWPCHSWDAGSEFEPRRPLQKNKTTQRVVLFFWNIPRAEARKGTSAARKTCRGHVLVPVCVSRRGSAASEPRFIRRRRRFGAVLVARGRVIECARETRLRFPPHTPPSLRYAGVQATDTAAMRRGPHGSCHFRESCLQTGACSVPYHLRQRRDHRERQQAQQC